MAGEGSGETISGRASGVASATTTTTPCAINDQPILRLGANCLSVNRAVGRALAGVSYGVSEKAGIYCNGREIGVAFRIYHAIN